MINCLLFNAISFYSQPSLFVLSHYSLLANPDILPDSDSSISQMNTHNNIQIMQQEISNQNPNNPVSQPPSPLCQTSAERQLANRIISCVSSLPSNSINWFWQLFANALDNINPQTPLAIELNFKQAYVEFSHSGRPFTIKSLSSLVNQATTKNQPLGLGLMSVFALTDNIEVQGIIDKEDGESKGETFSLHIERSTDSVNKLINQITTSKESLSSLQEIKETQPLPQGMTTRFRLFASLNLEEQINEIKRNLIYLFAFNKDLARVEIINKGDRKSYVRPVVADTYKQLRCKTLFLEIEGVAVDRLMFMERQGFVVAVPVLEKDKQLLIQETEDYNVLFRRYPVQEQLKLPFIINSQRFELDLTRSRLQSGQQNNKVLQQSFDLLFQLLSVTIPSLQNRQRLLSFRIPSTFSSLNLNDSYKAFISTQPIIKLYNKSREEYQTLSAIELPLIQSSNYVPETFIRLSGQLFYFANHFTRYPLDQRVYKSCLGFIFDDLTDWLRYIKPFDLKQLISLLETLDLPEFIHNIESMNAFQSKNRQLIVAYMNQLYGFLQKQFPVQLYNPSNRIALNLNYKLRKTKGLYSIKNPIPEQFLQFLSSQFGHDLRQILLAPGVNTKYFDLDQYDINKALTTFTRSLMEKQNLEVIDQIRLFRLISIFSESENKEGSLLEDRKLVYQVFKDLSVFKDVKPVISEHELMIDYRPFVERLVDSVFDKVSNSMQTLGSLSRLFEFQNQNDVIFWLNDFQAFLNRINYDKTFNRNLNRNGIFEKTQQLLVADRAITTLQIELFNKLPVQISIHDNDSNFRYQKIQDILLDPRIDREVFSRQNITPLSIDELLNSMIPQFRSFVDQKEVLNKRSELMLDYCDDLEEINYRQPSEDLQNKIGIMSEIRNQTAECLLPLRLQTDEDKQYIWRLMKDRKSFEALKELGRRYSLERIVKSASGYSVLDQQFVEQSEQLRIVRGDKERVVKECEAMMQEREKEMGEAEALMMSKHQLRIKEMEEQRRRDVERYEELKQRSGGLEKELKDVLMKKELEEASRKKGEDVEAQTVEEGRSEELSRVEKELEKRIEYINNLEETLREMRNNQAISTEPQQQHQRVEKVETNQQVQKVQEEKKEEQKQKIVQLNQQEKQQSLRQAQTQINHSPTNPAETQQVAIEPPHQESQPLQNPSQINLSGEQLSIKIFSSRYHYDKQTQCFIITDQTNSEQRAYLMILSSNSRISHETLNKIYKIKLSLYIGIVPEQKVGTQEELLNSLKIYSVWDLEIDKWYCSLKQAESKKNAAVRAKAGNGGFWFEYDINLKPRMKGRSFEQFKVQINKSKEKK